MNLQNIRVVQVNYGTSSLVIEGLHALQLERENFPKLSVMLIDNFSLDDSVKKLQSTIIENSWCDWVSLHISNINGGFAYGNNLGIKLSALEADKPEIFWLLNPDTRVIAGATQALVARLQENPNSIVGSRLEDDDGQAQCSTFRFPSIATEVSSGFKLAVVDRLLSKHLCCHDPSRPDWMAGASLMFTAATQQRSGEMDESYFLYYEEVDYLLHANSLGIHCLFVPESRVVHRVGASTGISDERKQQLRRPRYWFESRRLYFVKNHGRAYLLWADMLWSLGYTSWIIRKWLTKSEELDRRPPYFLSDFLRYSDLNPKKWISEICERYG
ncbi:MAG: N-acetylglucosaminyl-diphospho-decaprenol L-rhamnosyltransferase [Dinoroseobacter sp.]